MIESIRIRTVLFLGFLAFSAIYLLPSLVELPQGWWFNRKKLSYGLDIQGGAHLVYSVDVNAVVNERIDRMARTLSNIVVHPLRISTSNVTKIRFNYRLCLD